MTINPNTPDLPRRTGQTGPAGGAASMTPGTDPLGREPVLPPVDTATRAGDGRTPTGQREPGASAPVSTRPAVDPLPTRPTASPELVRPTVSEDPAPVRNPTEARQGAPAGRVRWVLILGIAISALVLVIAFLVVRPG